MTRRAKSGLTILLLVACGCSPRGEVSPAPPEAAEAVKAHWSALKRGDWATAHGQLHPDLAGGVLTRDRFAKLHETRRKAGLYDGEIAIEGSEGAGDDAIVRLAVGSRPARRVPLKRAGDGWKLMTHDLMADRP